MDPPTEYSRKETKKAIELTEEVINFINNFINK